MTNDFEGIFIELMSRLACAGHFLRLWVCDLGIVGYSSCREGMGGGGKGVGAGGV